MLISLNEIGLNNLFCFVLLFCRDGGDRDAVKKVRA